MSGRDGEVARDAAEVGQALAFPGDLRGQLSRMAADEAAVRTAVRAGWAGLAELQLVTAVLNGSAVAARTSGKSAARSGLLEAGVSGLEPAGGAGVTNSGGADAGLAVPRVAEASVVAAPRRESAGAGQVVERLVARGQNGSEGRVRGLPEGVGGTTAGAAPAIRAAEGVATDGDPPMVNGSWAGLQNGASMQRGSAPSVERSAPGLTNVEVSGTPTGSGMPASALGDRASGARGAAPVRSTPELRADTAAALRESVRIAMPEPLYRAPVGGRLPGLTSAGSLRRGSTEATASDSDAGGSARSGFDRAIAPQPQEQGAGGLGNGTGAVMLDGQLVGHWLSEQMARDAARPGAGTTFFDPRQAPAWTPSGSL